MIETIVRIRDGRPNLRHIVCWTAEPHDAHGDSPHDATYQRFHKEAGHRRNARQVFDHCEYLRENDHPLFTILTVGTGSKENNPILQAADMILQAADMLAYSEWQKMCGGNINIYMTHYT